MQRGAGGADAPPLASLQLVAFRDVLDNVVQEAHSGLGQLAERLPSLGDEERCAIAGGCQAGCGPCQPPLRSV